MLGKFVLAASSALLLAFVAFGFAGLLPGQPKLPVTVASGGIVPELPNGLPGLELFVPLVKNHFPDGIPQKFWLLVDFDKTVAEEWALKQVQVFEYTPLGTLIQDPYYAEVVGGTQPTEVIVAGLPEVPQYRMRLILAPYGEEVERDLGPVREESDTERRMKILEPLKKKYEDRAQQARKVLFEQGGVRVSLKL